MPERSCYLGPIRLAPGVRRRHACAYLFAAFVSIGLFTYLATLTPYLLEVNLGVPAGQQGVVTGNLQFWQEILMLGLIGFWGAMSDRFGRRPVYVAGFFVLAVAYLLYPTASSVPELTAYRLVFGVALAALTAMLSAVAADYAHEDSRGKLTGFSFLLNGIGAVLSFVFLSRLPAVFAAQGADPAAAGRYAYWTVAGIALLAAVLMFGLRPGRPEQVRDRTSVKLLLRDGVRAARNPRISLSYLGAFAARADMAAISLFLTLWIVQAGTSRGLSPEDAAARSGMVIGLALGASMLCSPLLGIVADRVNRLTLFCGGFLLAAIGYGWVGSLDDILAPAAIPALLLMGIGQSCTVLTSSVLLAQECPAGIRGAVFGLQNFCGAVGILALSAGGGWLYDTIGPQAPIISIAVANGLVGVTAVLLRSPGASIQQAARSGASDLTGLPAPNSGSPDQGRQDKGRERANGDGDHRARKQPGADVAEPLAGGGERRIRRAGQRPGVAKGHATHEQHRPGHSKHQYLALTQPDELGKCRHQSDDGGSRAKGDQYRRKDAADERRQAREQRAGRQPDVPTERIDHSRPAFTLLPEGGHRRLRAANGLDVVSGPFESLRQVRVADVRVGLEGHRDKALLQAYQHIGRRRKLPEPLLDALGTETADQAIHGDFDGFCPANRGQKQQEDGRNGCSAVHGLCSRFRN